MIPPVLLVLIAVLISSFGQVSLKYGMNLVGPISVGLKVIQAMFTPYVALGLLVYLLSSIFCLTALSREEVSYLYPLIAMGYVIVAVLSWWFFGDKIMALRWVGIVLICAGVALVARS